MSKRRIFILLVPVLMADFVSAKSTCEDISGQQAHPPLSTRGGTVCFVQEPVLNIKSGAPVGMDSISLYFVESGGFPVRAEGRGVLYDDTPGNITDAFSLVVDRQERVFVIHSVEIRNSLVEGNSSGYFYSVFVFDQIDGILRYDERASDWFGANYGWLSNGRAVTYRFPYQSREDVRLAMDSPFASLISEERVVRVRVNSKSFLFDGPDPADRTKKYLVKGERASVGKVSAGWCQIDYRGDAKLLRMWLRCDALDVEAQPKKAN